MVLEWINFWCVEVTIYLTSAYEASNLSMHENGHFLLHNWKPLLIVIKLKKSYIYVHDKKSPKLHIASYGEGN